MTKYPVVRLDNMQGTHDGTKLRSAVLVGATEPIVNGTVVQLGGLKDGEREIFEAALASKEGKPMCLVATPEVMYEDRKVQLTDFVNDAEGTLRCYIFCPADTFSLSGEYFETAPEKGAAMGVTNGKIMADGTLPLGTCIDVEQVGSLTYYVIEVA